MSLPPPTIDHVTPSNDWPPEGVGLPMSAQLQPGGQAVDTAMVDRRDPWTAWAGVGTVAVALKEAVAVGVAVAVISDVDVGAGAMVALAVPLIAAAVGDALTVAVTLGVGRIGAVGVGKVAVAVAGRIAVAVAGRVAVAVAEGSG